MIITPTIVTLAVVFGLGADPAPVNPCAYETVTVQAKNANFSYDDTKLNSGLYTVSKGKCVKK